MPPRPTRLSAGVVVIRETHEGWLYLLLRAYNHWDFPKGMVEAGEEPLAAAIREVREETLITELEFAWGEDLHPDRALQPGQSRSLLSRQDTHR